METPFNHCFRIKWHWMVKGKHASHERQNINGEENKKSDDCPLNPNKMRKDLLDKKVGLVWEEKV